MDIDYVNIKASYSPTSCCRPVGHILYHSTVADEYVPRVLRSLQRLPLERLGVVTDAVKRDSIPGYDCRVDWTHVDSTNCSPRLKPNSVSRHLGVELRAAAEGERD